MKSKEKVDVTDGHGDYGMETIQYASEEANEESKREDQEMMDEILARSKSRRDLEKK